MNKIKLNWTVNLPAKKGKNRLNISNEIHFYFVEVPSSILSSVSHCWDVTQTHSFSKIQIICQSDNAFFFTHMVLFDIDGKCRGKKYFFLLGMTFFPNVKTEKYIFLARPSTRLVRYHTVRLETAALVTVIDLLLLSYTLIPISTAFNEGKCPRQKKQIPRML